MARGTFYFTNGHKLNYTRTWTITKYETLKVQANLGKPCVLQHRVHYGQFYFLLRNLLSPTVGPNMKHSTVWGKKSVFFFNMSAATLNAYFTSFMSVYYYWHWCILGAGGGAVGWGTALQAGRSRVPFLMVSLEIFIWHNPSGHTVALGLSQPLIEMSTKNTSWG